MISYLLINLCISLLILVLLKFTIASNKVHYYLSCVGIIVWFIPYELIAQLIPNELLTQPIILNQSILAISSTLPDNIIAAQPTVFNYDQFLVGIFKWFMAIGVALFLFELARAAFIKRKIFKDLSLKFQLHLSKKYKIPTYSADHVPSGMILGVISPCIVVSNSVVESEQIDLIMCHEKKHLKRLDNLRLVLLSLAQNLFWWNPVVRLLVKHNRFLIEVLCDEVASKEFGVEEYINDFAALVLQNNESNMYSLSSTATSSKSNNILRLKQLKEDNIMSIKKKLAYVAIFITTAVTMVGATFAVAASQESNVNSGEGVMVDLVIKLNESSEKMIESNVSVWAEFEKTVSLSLSDSLQLNIKLSEIEGYELNEETSGLEGHAKIEMELLDFELSGDQIASAPMLVTAFGQEARTISNPGGPKSLDIIVKPHKKESL